MLTKKECLDALEMIVFVEGYYNLEHMLVDDKCCSLKYRMMYDLINEHFELQLTSSECDLIISGLKSLEEELGMDVMLLIDKLRKIQSTLPRGEGVVECVEID